MEPSKLIYGRILGVAVLCCLIVPGIASPSAGKAMGNVPSGVWVATGSMTSARVNFTATRLLTGELLVVGGRDGAGTTLASAELYDPVTGSWSVTGSMHARRQGHTATRLPNGWVMVAGGSNELAVLASAELYDPATGTWKRASEMTTPRQAHAAALVQIGGAPMVLAIGGTSGSSDCPPCIQKSAELFDPSTRSWSVTGSMSLARYWDRASPVTLLDGSVFVVGGTTCCGYTWINEAEIYNPATQTWTVTSAKTTTAQGPAALVIGGRVLVAGGDAGTQPNVKSVAASERFDVSTGSWQPVDKMSIPRDSLSLTVLGRQVLVAGGNNGGWGICNAQSSAEVLAPGAGWQLTGSMLTARFAHAATLLANGTVLVAGGTDCSGTVFASAELYVP
jgi:hypothetical protein